MIHHLVQKKSHGLTIIRVIFYGQKFIMFYDRPWIQWLFCDWGTMLEWGTRLRLC